MFNWLKDGVEWLLQLICGHGWTGGVEGAIPFAIGCGIVLFVGLCILGRTEQYCVELQGFADGDMATFGCSSMFISFVLFMILFAALYYSRSKNWVFVFALLTGGTPKEFCPTPYNFAEWPLRMKIIFWVALVIWIWSVFSCKYDKKPLRALIDKFFVMGGLYVVVFAYCYIRELSDANGKSLGFEWILLPIDIAFWCILAILPVAAMMSPASKEDKQRYTSFSTFEDSGSHHHRLNTGDMIQDIEGNSCRIRREGSFVYIRRPDGSEEQVYASEFDSNSTLTTSSGHRYNY